MAEDAQASSAKVDSAAAKPRSDIRTVLKGGVLALLVLGVAPFFCAELVAKSYEALGLLIIDSQHKPANAYSPSSFSSSNKHLDLEMGGELGDELVIILDDCPEGSSGGGKK